MIAQGEEKTNQKRTSTGGIGSYRLQAMPIYGLDADVAAPFTEVKESSDPTE